MCQYFCFSFTFLEIFHIHMVPWLFVASAMYCSMLFLSHLWVVLWHQVNYCWWHLCHTMIVLCTCLLLLV